jgi:hypothetical protein
MELPVGVSDEWTLGSASERRGKHSGAELGGIIALGAIQHSSDLSFLAARMSSGDLKQMCNLPMEQKRSQAEAQFLLFSHLVRGLPGL